jgi:hypothetical protein
MYCVVIFWVFFLDNLIFENGTTNCSQISTTKYLLRQGHVTEENTKIFNIYFKTYGKMKTSLKIFLVVLNISAPWIAWIYDQNMSE